jgi:hypothetical protein
MDFSSNVFHFLLLDVLLDHHVACHINSMAYVACVCSDVPVHFVEKIASIDRQLNLTHASVTRTDLLRAKKAYEAEHDELAQAHFNRRNVSSSFKTRHTNS